MEKIHESKFQQIMYDAETGILTEVWLPETAEMEDEDFQTEMKQQVFAVRSKQPKGVLTESLQMRYAISIDMQEWLNSEIFPQFIAIGVIKIAMLLPEEIIAQLSIEQSMDESEGSKFQVQYFSEKDKAMEWLG